MIYDLCDFCRLVMLARWFTKQYRERPDLVKVGGGVFTHKTHQMPLQPVKIALKQSTNSPADVWTVWIWCQNQTQTRPLL